MRIAEAACDDYAERVIEIGSGAGALTRHLLPRTGELHAVELDPELAERLRLKFPSEPKLHIHSTNVLATDLSQWGPAVIAGNLPYYITSPIISEYLRLDGRFQRAVFLTQWEVAERVTAKPGTRDYGYLSVSVQLLCDVELICKVPPSAFSPPPKVDSAVFRLHRKRERPPDLSALLTFVGRCFVHKRKTLRNNLRPFYGQAVDEMQEAGLRAEQLSVPQFVDLWNRIARTEKQ